MIMRRFVIGDIHGAHRAMMQCFERSGFDREQDLLVSMGDLGDGWPDTDKVFDELLTVKNLILILGNHDLWLLKWLQTGAEPEIWLSQGGNDTINSLRNNPAESYRNLLESARLYWITDNCLFVHGGIIPEIPLDKQDAQVFLWDRSLVMQALQSENTEINSRLTTWDKVFVGHTPTINFDSLSPIITSGVYMMDTGAGWPGGVLTIMDIDTEEYHSSEKVEKLYKNHTSR